MGWECLGILWANVGGGKSGALKPGFVGTCRV